MNCLNCKASCQEDHHQASHSKVIPLFIAENEKTQEALPNEFVSVNVESAAFMRYVQNIGLLQIFGKLPDPRLQSRCTYSMASLSAWAFYTCAFRQGSKNAMQTSIESLATPDNKEGFFHLLNIKEGQKTVPHSSVVDDALSKVDCMEFSEVLWDLFDRLIEQKTFYHNQETLLPYNTFQIGTDGFWIHHYEKPHSTDAHGENTCPYCLPRVHNKGKPNQFTTWVHVIVTFVLICGGGLTLPLYAYPLKASQIKEGQSDEDLKEECELAAAHIVLPLIRERYPKLSFTFLGDSLYANQQFVRLCEQLTFNYIIVLKEGSQKNLHKRCDGLARTEFYQQNYTSEEREISGKETIVKKAAWFNAVEMGGVFTNVLRFEENIIKQDGSSELIYKGAWICSKKIFHNGCFKRAKQGRSRWDHEDLHNTLKNRGYDIKHDIARANPNLLMVWKIMMFIAFFVTELFMRTSVAQALQKTRSCMKFAKDMLQQFIERSWAAIALSPILIKARVQFRFNFLS